jgi:hypothetical protein
MDRQHYESDLSGLVYYNRVDYGEGFISVGVWVLGKQVATHTINCPWREDGTHFSEIQSTGLRNLIEFEAAEIAREP